MFKLPPKATKLQIPRGTNINILLQQFLSCSNSTPSEVQEKTEFLEELLNYHNDILDKDNQGLTPQDLPLFLSEECDLCNFSSHTVRGIKIHKAKKHKNQMWDSRNNTKSTISQGSLWLDCGWAWVGCKRRNKEHQLEPVGVRIRICWTLFQTNLNEIHSKMRDFLCFSFPTGA